MLSLDLPHYRIPTLPHFFRIAPTPSGLLHPGNAFNFILTALLARIAGASLRLRIDDADAVRARTEYLEDIFGTLAWLGIEWQEGPRDAQDHTAHFSQRLRAARYREALEALIATGAVFACACSRKDILAHSPDGQYPGTCRDRGLLLDTPNTALRLRTPTEVVISFCDILLGEVRMFPFELARDPVIHRRDGLPAYHVASLTDDLDFGITHIVRGEDLLESTVAQLFFSQTLGGTSFDRVTFYHHPLLRGKVGEKLSKSAGSASLRAMRATGKAPSVVYGYFSQWMGWPHTVTDFSGAAECFIQYGLGTLKLPALPRASGK